MEEAAVKLFRFLNIGSDVSELRFFPEAEIAPHWIKLVICRLIAFFRDWYYWEGKKRGAGTILGAIFAGRAECERVGGLV